MNALLKGILALGNVVAHGALTTLVNHLKPLILGDPDSKENVCTIYDGKVLKELKENQKINDPAKRAEDLEARLTKLDREYLDSKQGRGDLDASNYYNPETTPEAIMDPKTDPTIDMETVRTKPKTKTPKKKPAKAKKK